MANGLLTIEDNENGEHFNLDDTESYEVETEEVTAIQVVDLNEDPLSIDEHIKHLRYILYTTDFLIKYQEYCKRNLPGSTFDTDDFEKILSIKNWNDSENICLHTYERIMSKLNSTYRKLPGCTLKSRIEHLRKLFKSYKDTLIEPPQVLHKGTFGHLNFGSRAPRES